MNMKITPIVLRLLIANIAVFVILQISGMDTLNDEYFVLHKTNLLGLRPVTTVDFVDYFTVNDVPLVPANAFKPVQILTSFFNHGGLWHIFFNMWALVNFGSVIEMVFGPRRFLAFYLFCGLVGGLITALLDPSPIPVVGASGAIFGLMVAFAIFFPHNKLTFMVPIPLTFEARTWMMIFGGISTLFVILGFVRPENGITGGISHFGHLAGMIAALIFFYSGIGKRIS